LPFELEPDTRRQFRPV